MSSSTEAACLLIFVLSFCPSVNADCVKGFKEAGLETKVIVPQAPRSWSRMKRVCNTENKNLQLVTLETILTDELKRKCGDVLVPVFIYSEPEYTIYYGESREIPTPLERDTMDTSYPILNRGFGALNLTSGLWHLVVPSVQFTCVICSPRVLQEIADRSWYNEPQYAFMLQPFQVTLVGKKRHVGRAELTDDENEGLMEEIRSALACEITSNYRKKLALHSTSIDDDSRLVLIYYYKVVAPDEPDGRKWLPVFEEMARKDHSTAILQKYTIQVTDMSYCPEDLSLVDKKTVLWPQSESGVVQTSVDAATGYVIRRECAYNKTEGRLLWTTPIYWEVVFHPCSLEKQFTNEIHYQNVISSLPKAKHDNVWLRFKASPVNETVLQMIGKITNDFYFNYGDDIPGSLTSALQSMLLRFQFGKDQVSYILSKRVVQFVSIDLETAATPDGAAFDYELSELCHFHCPKEPIKVTLTKRFTSDEQAPGKFAVQLSDGLTSASSRLAFFVTWRSYMSNRTKEFIAMNAMHRFPDIKIALALKAGYSDGLSLDADKYFVDFSYDLSSAEKGIFDAGCAAWNNYLKNWTNNGCLQLKADRGSRTVCRCRGKYFLQEDTMLVGKFGIFANSINTHLDSLFTNRSAIAVSMTIEVILSGLGLLSIILTAILFKKWRENSGHKILLHMTMSLTSNLVLGFTTSLVHFDTEGDACLTIGVFRHYSFLAMFFWMLVLAGLQMQRLTTVAGAKATSHLILKVALFAWGVPLLPIVVLLAWNTRFYRSDRFDRGYCYPEGLVFELTVQAPAGIILVVNLGVFVNVLRHIFECTGEKKVTKHSKNSSAENLNRLKTSLFIFILFGFTWVFHFLSEERVIVSEFLFEYLFLMTATFHLLMLALFFILLQEGTRNLWLEEIKSWNW